MDGLYIHHKYEHFDTYFWLYCYSVTFILYSIFASPFSDILTYVFLVHPFLKRNVDVLSQDFFNTLCVCVRVGVGGVCVGVGGCMCVSPPTHGSVCRVP